MSKHTPRASRWTQLNAKEYRSAFGTVCYRRGAWEGTVVYELWQETPGECHWLAQSCDAGRYKRPRNAMMAVEEKARRIKTEFRDRVRMGLSG
jgi:hypothetical protein